MRLRQPCCPTLDIALECASAVCDDVRTPGWQIPSLRGSGCYFAVKFSLTQSGNDTCSSLSVPSTALGLTWLEVCRGKFWREEPMKLLAQKVLFEALRLCLLLVVLVGVEGHLLVCYDNPHIYSAHHN